MQVLCYDPYPVKGLEAEYVSLDELLKQSDVISLHCPLTDTSYHLINESSIAKMRQGAILINTGRGALVDEQAVAKALREGRLAAYGTDVMAEEPPRPDNPLFSEPNAFITPHIAWATVEARERLLAIAAENIRAFIAGEPQNVVNKEMLLPQ